MRGMNTFYSSCDYLSVLGLNSIYVSKRGLRRFDINDMVVFQSSVQSQQFITRNSGLWLLSALFNAGVMPFIHN